ncbi:hypothetical protein [Deinococcus radiotolerans]|uniref:Uncharacterized protein n=1 Tax=Deinococcus radiotolerans TaxID=1309407 RepID=A0ABQ2FR27_9DEIO|nr:hypothetical protein [Deinococcus radiotolerans]GGL18362.1 hypothetical protein GCM10010844_41500 [Deinococcus radiotolerans]
MTGRISPELASLRREATREIQRASDVTFRHTATFVDAEGSEWELQYSLRDPQQIGPRAIAAAEAAARSFEVPYRDVRLLTPKPGQVLPAVGATANHVNLSGELEGEIKILDWAQESDFTRISRATCVLRR